MRTIFSSFLLPPRYCTLVGGGFPRGGGRANIFPKNCMKIKNYWPRGVGRVPLLRSTTVADIERIFELTLVHAPVISRKSPLSKTNPEFIIPDFFLGLKLTFKSPITPGFLRSVQISKTLVHNIVQTQIVRG